VGKILIATMGGTSAPVVESINDSNYEEVVIVTTEENRGLYESDIKSAAEKNRAAALLKIIKDHEAPEETFTVISKKIAKYYRESYSGSDIYVNITGGTKAMAAGALYAAVSRGVGNCIYVGGTKREKVTGRVITGYGTIKKTRLSELLIDSKIKEVKMLFNSMEYDAAVKTADAAEKEIGIELNSDLILGFLRNLAEAYGYWDKMLYDTAAEAFKKIKVSDEIESELPVNFEKTLNMAKEAVNKAAKSRFYALIDKYFAALRYMDKGYYMIAVEMFYSAAEFAADYILEKEYGLDKSNIDIVKALKYKGADKIWLEKFRNEKNKKIQMPLFNSYELLEKMGNEYGKEFIKNKKYHTALQVRNDMIHGNKPVDKKSAAGLAEVSREMIEKFCGFYSQEKTKTLEKIGERFRFPKI